MRDRFIPFCFEADEESVWRTAQERPRVARAQLVVVLRELEE